MNVAFIFIASTDFFIVDMEQQKHLVVVTGAEGFIGSALVALLNSQGIEDLVLVDDFSRVDKAVNLSDKKYAIKVHRSQFEVWLEQHGEQVKMIYHLGAKTDTTLQDKKIFKELNVLYSQMIWNFCVQYQIPLVYASSAATYGDGALGYDDNEALIPELKPLNPYGISKNDFDIWALQQKEKPPYWYGLKFFNVYGPNEYHKGRMASVIFHAFHQIQKEHKARLFRSHRDDYADGGQLRDFIYVKDVVQVATWLMQHLPQSGIYNLGTGKARSFNDLVTAIFTALNLPMHIEYIDTPLDIRDSYQYYTQANMQKVKDQGLDHAFYSLEDGVKDYVQQYLQQNKVW